MQVKHYRIQCPNGWNSVRVLSGGPTVKVGNSTLGWKQQCFYHNNERANQLLVHSNQLDMVADKPQSKAVVIDVFSSKCKHQEEIT